MAEVYSTSRYFLVFDQELNNNVISEIGHRALFQPREVVVDVHGLITQIHREFAIPPARRLHVAVNGYTVPQWSLISVLRDNDELAVFAAGQLPAALPAAQKEAHAQPLLLTAAAGGGLVQPSPEAGIENKPKKKRSRAEGAATAAGEAAAPETAPKKRKAAAAQALNVQPSSAAGATQEAAQVPQGTPDPSSEDSEGEPGKTPSRSARRKKLKRQLRREAGTSGANAGRDTPSRAGAPRAAPAAAATAAPGAPPPPLPRRGEAWPMGAREQRFAARGHVYFSESDEERGTRTARQEAQQPGLRAERAERAEGPHGRAPQKGSAAGGAATLAGPGAPEHAAAPRDTQKGSQLDAAQEKPHLLHEQHGPSTAAEFEALPRPQPVPFEGDVIGYRLLHISADWTPQVSDWRMGRVIDWEEGTQTLTVEPWPDPAAHPLQPRSEARRRELTGDESWAELDSLILPEQERGGAEQDGGEEEADGEDELPSDYSADGVLTATLQSFADLRIISEPHAPAAARVAGGGLHEQGEQAAAPGPAAAQAAAAGGPPQHCANTTPVPQTPTEQVLGLANGSAFGPVPFLHTNGDADTPADSSPALLVESSACLAPPKPGRSDIMSISAWKDLAEQLKQRRAELAAQQGAPPCITAPAQHRGAQLKPLCSGAQTCDLEERCGAGAGAGAGEKQAAGDGCSENGGARGTQFQASAVTTPGAARPPPGVRATSVGAFLQRMRRQDAEAASS